MMSLLTVYCALGSYLEYRIGNWRTLSDYDPEQSMSISCESLPRVAGLPEGGAIGEWVAVS